MRGLGAARYDPWGIFSEVRGTLPFRVGAVRFEGCQNVAVQGLTFRDTDYVNLPDAAADGAPEFTEGALFVLRGGRFDPAEPYELVFLGSRYDQRGAFSRDFREFTSRHQLPEWKA